MLIRRQPAGHPAGGENVIHASHFGPAAASPKILIHFVIQPRSGMRRHAPLAYAYFGLPLFPYFLGRGAQMADQQLFLRSKVIVEPLVDRFFA